jgi:hypothetical protein
METLAELRAREEEIGREWQWLQDALNAVARARVEVRLRMAALEASDAARRK